MSLAFVLYHRVRSQELAEFIQLSTDQGRFSLVFLARFSSILMGNLRAFCSDLTNGKLRKFEGRVVERAGSEITEQTSVTENSIIDLSAYIVGSEGNVSQVNSKICVAAPGEGSDGKWKARAWRMKGLRGRVCGRNLELSIIVVS